MGYLHIVSGSMFSGKTTRLIELFYEYNVNNNILIFNHCIDQRYSKEAFITTHNLEKVVCNQIDRLDQIKLHPNYKQTNIVMIDEIQFFNDVKTIIMDMVEIDNKHVIIAGLLTDADRNVFGDMIDLIPYADVYEQKYSKCYFCDTHKGLFTLRKTQSNCVVDVGSSDKYISVCREHYKRYHYLKK